VPGQTRSSLRERLEHLAHAATNLRSPSQSVRNPTTEFQLGVMGDAGPEITNGLGAFLYVAPSGPVSPGRRPPLKKLDFAASM
jgi:hypothetical protein